MIFVFVWTDQTDSLTLRRTRFYKRSIFTTYVWWQWRHDLNGAFFGRKVKHRLHRGKKWHCMKLLDIWLKLESFIEDIHVYDYWFQQHNAIPHVADHTKVYFTELGIPVLEWPECIPDLKSIENLWGILFHDLYACLRQFSYKNDLQDAMSLHGIVLILKRS